MKFAKSDHQVSAENDNMTISLTKMFESNIYNQVQDPKFENKFWQLSLTNNF